MFYQVIYQKLLDLPMINIISEFSQINQDLTEFPKANLNVAIFGTQSSGKSTLLNHVFGTKFPVLDTTITRERCTKGVWFHNVNNINVIDTQGFDSSQREPQQKMFQKKVALFCLAISDVLIINMWMNEIGRYEASHSHILKAIIRASEKIIASQQRKIIFVVRDCTPDADRNILKDQLHTHMMGIVKAQTQKSTMKFNLEYFMMSHYFQDEKQFKKEAKDLLKSISVGRKSNLGNYSNEDRLVYIKKLWETICSSQSEINLRTVEDVLRNYALQRIKRESIQHMQKWLDQVKDLSKHKTYSRLKEATYKEVRSFFLSLKPRHLKDTEVQNYIEEIIAVLQSKQNKLFMSVLLPQEEDRLISQEYEAKLDAIQYTNVKQFKTQMEKYRREIEEAYKVIVKDLRQYARMTRRFIQKIQSKNTKYDQLLEHIENLFVLQLESALNQQVDKQTQDLQFDSQKLKKIIKIIEERHKSDSTVLMSEIWQKVLNRTSNSTIIQRIKSQGSGFSTASMGFMLGNQTQGIISYYRKLEVKAISYLSGLVNFNCTDDETTVNLQKFQQIHRVITSLIDQKLMQESRRFKITLVFVGLLMYLFFSEFKLFMKVFGMTKKRLRRWVWLYVCIMLSIFGVVIFRNKDYFKKFIEPIDKHM